MSRAGWSRRAGERIGPYRLLSPIGRGGFSEVWKVEADDGRRLALKLVVHPEHAEQLRAEASSLGLIRGRGIVAVHAMDLAHEPPYLVMDYLPGGDLRQHMKERTLRIGDSIKLVERLLELLTRLQREGVVHGDLKPENLLFDAGGNLHISDFGLSRRIQQKTATLSVSLSRADARIAGTIEYMAPEQRAGRKPDHRSDVYAAGVILHELLLGERPQGLAEAPSERRRDLPRAVDRILAGALATDPGRRWESASAFLSRLRLELWNEYRTLRATELGLLHRNSIAGAAMLMWAIVPVTLGAGGGMTVIDSMKHQGRYRGEPPPPAWPSGPLGLELAVALVAGVLTALLVGSVLWRWLIRIRADLELVKTRLDTIRGWHTPTQEEAAQAARQANQLRTRGLLARLALCVRWRLRRWRPSWRRRLAAASAYPERAP